MEFQITLNYIENNTFILKCSDFSLHFVHMLKPGPPSGHEPDRSFYIWFPHRLLDVHVILL